VPARDPHARSRVRHRAGPDAGIRLRSLLSPARMALASRTGAIERRAPGRHMSGLVEASGGDGDPASQPHRAAPEKSPPEAAGGPTGEVLHALFEATVDASPQAVAVLFADEASSYAELERRANRIARQLRRRGVGRGSVVGLLVPPSTDAYAALLGILKAGAPYAPIDPEWPTERAASILEDSHAIALVTTAGRAAAPSDFDGSLLRLDADGAEIDAESGARLAPGDL